MYFMSATLEVSQPEASRDASDEQPENMKYMFVTLEVSQPEASRDASEEQPENMLLILVADETSRPERSMVSTSERPLNRFSAYSEVLTPATTLTARMLPLYSEALQGAFSS